MRFLIPTIAVLGLTACATPYTTNNDMAVNCPAKAFELYFNTGDSSLTTDAKMALNEVANSYQNCELYKIEVEGHADSVGTSANNLKLSEARAVTVVEALDDRGISADRIRIIPLGESEAMTNGVPNSGLRKTEVRLLP